MSVCAVSPKTVQQNSTGSSSGIVWVSKHLIHRPSLKSRLDIQRRNTIITSLSRHFQTTDLLVVACLQRVNSQSTQFIQVRKLGYTLQTRQKKWFSEGVASFYSLLKRQTINLKQQPIKWHRTVISQDLLKTCNYNKWFVKFLVWNLRSVQVFHDCGNTAYRRDASWEAQRLDQSRIL